MKLISFLALIALAACNLDSALPPPEPYLVQDAYVKASNTGAGDLVIGVALSSDGKTLAFGALREDGGARVINGDATGDGAVDSGAVYVYVADGDGWKFQAYVKPSNTDAGDFFGGFVALSADGSMLAVTSVLEDGGIAGIDGDDQDNTLSQAGAVFVFRRVGEEWSQEAYLKSSNPNNFDTFGSSMAMSANGAVLAVGAKGEGSAARGINGDQTNNSAMLSGAVYIFARNGGAWSQQAYLKSSTSAAGDLFGGAGTRSIAVAGDGNTLAVGAAGEDDEDLGTTDSGAVYVFTRTGTTWQERARITAAHPSAGDQFGAELALSGDGATLAVAAREEDSSATGIGGDQLDESAEASGAVFVFRREANVWTQDAYIKASNAAATDRFGTMALSADGRYLAVGAPDEDGAFVGPDESPDDSVEAAGAVYLFERVDTWVQRAYVKPSNSDALDGFGGFLALSADGSRLAISAPNEDGNAMLVGGNEDDNSAPTSGAVYTFTRNAPP